MMVACYFMLAASNALAEENNNQASTSSRMIWLFMSGGQFFKCVEYLVIANFEKGGLFFVTFLFFYAAYFYSNWRRIRTLKKADEIVAADRQKYDTIWSDVLDTENQRVLLHELKLVATSICSPSTESGGSTMLGGGLSRKDSFAPGRDVQSELVAPNLERLRQASAAANTSKPRQCVSDMAVLFAQAAALNPHFQASVSFWATGVDGAHVKSIPIKRKNRAIEKLFRSYAGNPSGLVDIVRSAITFSTIEGIIQTLKKIRDDQRVTILQIKNRLDPDVSSAESAGYRNLALSLIIVDDTTMPDGLDTHICELQLGLSAIDEVKNAEGHRRYVKWRDMLAE
jgi:hypothetical protein